MIDKIKAKRAVRKVNKTLTRLNGAPWIWVPCGELKSERFYKIDKKHYGVTSKIGYSIYVCDQNGNVFATDNNKITTKANELVIPFVHNDIIQYGYKAAIRNGVTRVMAWAK